MNRESSKARSHGLLTFVIAVSLSLMSVTPAVSQCLPCSFATNMFSCIDYTVTVNGTVFHVYGAPSLTLDVEAQVEAYLATLPCGSPVIRETTAITETWFCNPETGDFSPPDRVTSPDHERFPFTTPDALAVIASPSEETQCVDSENTDVSFSSAGSVGVPGYPVEFQWTVRQGPDVLAESTDAEFTLPLPAGGPYTATLTVTSRTCQNTATFSFRVSEPHAVIAEIPAVIQIPSGVTGAPVGFDGSGSFETGGSPVTYSWNVFGTGLATPIERSDPVFTEILPEGDYFATLMTAAGTCEDFTSIPFRVCLVCTEGVTVSEIELDCPSDTNPPADFSQSGLPNAQCGPAGMETGRIPSGLNVAQGGQQDGKTCSSCGHSEGTGCGLFGDPVHIQTGRLFDRYTDLTQATIRGSLTFTRSYRSDRSGQGHLGVGWTHSFERSLQLQPGVGATEVDERGQTLFFAEDGQGGYLKPPNRDVVLEVPGGDTVSVLYLASGRRFQYQLDGKLVAITDNTGVTLTLTYDSAGSLARVQDVAGRGFDFVTTDGLLRVARDALGQEVSFAYDA